jgi:DNA uptake protein ComE-like DNA-binding protein
MTPHQLKPILLAMTMLLAANQSLRAQEAKPAPVEAKANQDTKVAPKRPAVPATPVKKPVKKAVPPPPNYILGEEPLAKKPSAKPPKPQFAAKKKPTKIPYDKRLNLNTASKEELMKLPGMTAEYAAKVIAGRPYVSKQALLLKDIIPSTVYFLVKDQVAAGKPAGK